jgi:hypothetical protein
MPGAEREFTLGAAAHNYPVIKGLVQSRKQPKLIALGGDGGRLKVKIDLTACYDPAAQVCSVARTVWLRGRDLVVVADEIDTASPSPVIYHWHGHPDAAWWTERGWLLLHLPDADLWFTSPQAPLSTEHIVRLEGSRGQLTAAAEITPAPHVVWWIFSIGSAHPEHRLLNGGRQLQTAGASFHV